MIGLYESILSDMEDIFTTGDVIADEMVINDPDSKLRGIFSIEKKHEKPFKLDYSNGKNLIVDYKNAKWGDFIVYGDQQVGNISDTINIDTLTLEGNAKIWANENTYKCLCNNIIADSINILCSRENSIKNLNITAKKTNPDDNLKHINSISIDGCPYISNCNFEIYEDSKVFTKYGLRFNRIPELKNINSNTIDRINILDSLATYPVPGGKSPRLAEDIKEKMSKLFNYNYKLTAINAKTEKTDEYNIKSLTSIIRILKHYSYNSYDKFPYSLNKNIKLNDIIDVSGFKNLQFINISDRKYKTGILLVNTNSKFYNTDAVQDIIYRYRFYLLKTIYNQKLNEFIKEAPVTADGWQVFLYYCV